MAQVPGVPVPDISPVGGNAAPQQIQAPAGAFAGQVLGGGLEDAAKAAGVTADELYQHAVKFQQINNTIAANQAGQDAQKKMLDLKTQFENLGGMQAYGALPQYQQAIQNTLDAGAESLNPAARAEYLAQTRRMQLGLQESGQTFALAQRKSAQQKTYADTVDLQSAIYANSSDLAVKAAAMANITDAAGTHAADTGEPQDGVLLKVLSGLRAGDVKEKLDAGDYQGAQKLYSEYKDNNGLTAEDSVRLAGAMRQGAANYAIHTASVAIAAHQGFSVNVGGVGHTVPTGPDGKLDTNAFLEWTLDQEGRGPAIKDVNGADVRYGINAAYNPGVDLNTLTQEGAKQIYQSKYINDTARSIADPNMQAAYINARIMGGPADKWLQDSGGDVNKFIDEQQAYQRNDIAAHPNKQKFASIWQNRTDQLRPGEQVQVPAPPTFAPDASEKDIDAQTIAYARTVQQLVGAKNPVLADQIEQAAIHQLDLDKRMIVDTQTGGYSHLVSALQSGVDAGGKPFLTLNDLSQAYPGASDDLNRLPYSQFTNLQKDFNAYKNGTGTYNTPQQQARMETLMGMRETDNASFLKINPMTETDLGTADRMKIYQEQMQDKKRAASGQARESTVNQYLSDGVLSTRLQSLFQSANYKQQEPYQQFVGQFQAELEARQASNGGKPVDHNTGVQIAQKLLAQHVTAPAPLMQMFGAKETYNAPFSPQDIKTMGDTMRARTGGVYGPDEIARMLEWQRISRGQGVK